MNSIFKLRKINKNLEKLDNLYIETFIVGSDQNKLDSKNILKKNYV